MRHFSFKSLVLFLLFVSCIEPPAFSQSGRGRPSNPGRNPSTVNPPQPVTVPEAATVLKQERVGNTAYFTLKNGITVIIREAHAYPVAAVVASFKTKQLNEANTPRGLPALTARLLFRGTQFRTAEQIAGDTRALGAFLSEDSTFDTLSLNLITPQEKLKEALAIQADLIQNPLFTAEDLSRELALGEDLTTVNLNAARNPKAALFDARALSLLNGFNHENYSAARLIHLALWQNQDAVSSQTNPSITRDQLLEFYQAHCRPDNLIIAVTGDVITFNALVEIQRLFGTFKVRPTPSASSATAQPATLPTTKSAVPQPAKPSTAQKSTVNSQPGTPQLATTKPAANTVTTPASPPAPAAPIEALRYANERGDTSLSIINIGFQVPGFNAKEWAALEMLNAILTRGRGSRLSSELIHEQNLVSSLRSDYLAIADKGLLLLQLFIQPNAIDKTEAAFFRELNRLRRETPGPSEMARARLLLEKHYFEENANYLNQAGSLVRAEALQGGFRAAVDYRKTLQAVTAEEVQRAAAKYLTLTNTSVYEYEANSAPPRTFDTAKFTETVMAWAPTFAEAVDAKQVRAAAEPAKATQGEPVEKSADDLGTLESMLPLEIKNYSTLNGPTVYVKENHTEPLVTIGFIFQGGRMIEDETNGGATALMLRSMLYGSTKRPQAVVQLEQLGAEVSIINENDFFGLLLTVLSPNAESALRIVREVIEDPAFDDEAIKKASQEQLGLVQRERLSTSVRSRELVNQALFPNHTYSFSAQGREETLNKLKGDYLREWHDHTIKRQLPLLMIVGDTNGSALITSEVVNGFRRSEVDSTLKARTAAPVKPEEKLLQQRIGQTSLTLGFSGPKGDSDDTLAFALIQGLMNGRGGRLISELRNKQGLALQAFFDYQAMKITGAAYASLNAPVENESRARSALLAELEKIGKVALSTEELSNAKALAALQSGLKMQNPRTGVIEYARAICYQKPIAEVDAYAEKLNKLTAEEVRRVFSTYFKPASLATGILRGTQSQKATSQ